MSKTEQGKLAVENDEPANASMVPRAASEEAAVAERGGRVMIVRLPQVHDTRKAGLVTPLVEIARKEGASAYSGEGLNRWPAAHLSDTARLYQLVLEKGEAGQGTTRSRNKG